MAILWGSISGFLIYLEILYHFSSFGFTYYNPILVFIYTMAISGVLTLLIGAIKGKVQKIVFHVFSWIFTLWFMAEEVYYHIFKQPLLMEAVYNTGGDALSNYWREALTGILEVAPFLLLMLAPAITAIVLMKKKKWILPVFRGNHLLRAVLIACVGVVGCITVHSVEASTNDVDFEAYYEFIDPMTVAERSGIMPMSFRDMVHIVEEITGNQIASAEDSIDLHMTYDPNASYNANVLPNTADEDTQTKPEENKDEMPEELQEIAEEEPVILPHGYEINTDKLYELSEGKKKTWMADYITSRQPDMTNDYTGMFEGCNLIFLTAEGFSPYCVSEELTPTLYRMIHQGIYFENYYVPLWQTSTSDGEYINCTGLIPDGQFSMKRSAENDMSYTLPGFFAPQDVLCMAYHNNSLSYYDRHLSHNNLGYFFKACSLGNLDRSEWESHLFEMEGAKHWPASDYNMMVATMDEYIHEDQFLTYYMTVSGHMNYNFAGNRQSSRNKEAVANLDMSENARAYIACNIELDKAMEYMLQRLEEEGKLENTLIVLSADHYPYAMTDEQLEELSGREDINYAKDKFRNNLILWSPRFEENPKTITKACGSMDLLPTILNLFGFDYDSRMYAGRDIFSENEGLVIFNDKSFVTDRCIYKRKEKEIIWVTDENGNPLVPEEEQEAYLEYYKNEVSARYTFSAYMLQEDYYNIVRQSVVNPLPEMPAEKRLPVVVPKEEESEQEEELFEETATESGETE